MSRGQYELSAAARLDLFQTWNYLAENASFEVADKVIHDIEEAILKVVSWPGRGHRRPDLTERDVLFYGVHSYLIVYRQDKKPLHVLRVLHAARDAGEILKE
jgi:plasmid stabilization system protein ParE